MNKRIRSPPGRPKAGDAPAKRQAWGPTIWLFDLDDTLHDAANASMPGIHVAMGEYMQHELRLSADEAQALRRRYWQRYGATLLGLVRHHGVQAAHFLHDTHRLPGLEARVSGHRDDFAAIRRLPGRKLILTNAPRAYALRVLGALRIEHLFDAVISIEDMWMFGHLRPKPDARMFRALCAKLRVHPRRCVLVEDTLVHQKAARAVGMATVWMRRYAPRGDSRLPAGAPRRPHVPRRPAYVDRVVCQLRRLVRAAGPSAAAAPPMPGGAGAPQPPKGWVR